MLTSLMYICGLPISLSLTVSNPMDYQYNPQMLVRQLSSTFYTLGQLPQQCMQIADSLVE